MKKPPSVAFAGFVGELLSASVFCFVGGATVGFGVFVSIAVWTWATGAPPAWGCSQ